METRLITTDDCLWEESLAQTSHDFHHLPRYVALSAEQEGGDGCAFLATEGTRRMLVPLVVRPIESTESTGRVLYDAASPYGYPSPLVWNLESNGSLAAGTGQEGVTADDPTEGFVRRAVEKLEETLRARDVASLFVRFHPLLPVPLEPFRRKGTLVHHGQTVFLDLSLSDEEQWRQVRPQHRNRINRAVRNGLVGEFDESWESFDDFFEIYNDTMRRVGASPFYFFAKQYFVELKDALGDALHLGLVRVDGDVACVGLFTEMCGIVQFHLSGHRMEHNEHHPLKYLVDHVRRWAMERGNRVFHLGGGLGAQNDSLMNFKAGFSKLRGEYYTWRRVLDDEAYRGLVGQWEREAGTAAPEPADFFPAYRKPVHRPVETLGALSGEEDRGACAGESAQVS